MADETLQRLRSQAFEHSLDALIGGDLFGTIIDWNTRATELFGWTPAEAIGKNIGELILSEGQRLIYEHELANFRVTGKSARLNSRMEFRALRRDGTRLPIELQVTPVSTNGTQALYASISDISQRLTAIADREQSERQFQQILDSVSDLVFVKVKGSRLSWANRAFRDYYAMSNEQLKGLIDAPNSEPDHTLKYVRDDAFVFQTGQTLDISEEPVTRHDDQVRWFHTVKSPILDNEGKTAMIVGVSRDITDRKETEQRLRQNEQLLQTLIDHSPFVVYVKDLEGRHILINREFERMYNVRAKDTLGMTDVEIFGSSMSQVFRASDERILATGASEQFEETHEIPAGTHSFFTVKFPLKHPDGKIYAICGISTDITEMRRAQSTIAEQRAKMVSAAKMSALGEMAGGIAHEINNPLAVIHLRASQIRQVAAMMESGKQQLEIAESAERIESTAMRISKIVKSLRSFSRDDIRDPFQQVSLQSIIDDTVNLCSARFMDHKVSLTMEPLPPGLMLDCRPGQISQVLLNLMNNAHDAVESLSDRWVKVRTLDEGDSVSVQVFDSGEGIPELLRDKIMQPFFTTKEIGKGTGLGLSISRGIIESHRGQLTLDTESPDTCFVFRVPKSQLTPPL